MKIRIKKSKTLTKHIYCNCKGNFDGRKCNLNQKCNNKKRRCGCKNLRKYYVCKNYYI